MESNNIYKPGEEEEKDNSGDDPFLKRIQMQGKIIRKMLIQFDSPEDSSTNLPHDGQTESDSSFSA
ncbi:MAG: hypothetical protein Q8M08_05995 [Bacteroidales bacterium]|nr:hypothetical protein [Bacteroidales bacterium]